MDPVSYKVTKFSDKSSRDFLKRYQISLSYAFVTTTVDVPTRKRQVCYVPPHCCLAPHVSGGCATFRHTVVLRHMRVCNTLAIGPVSLTFIEEFIKLLPTCIAILLHVHVVKLHGRNYFLSVQSGEQPNK